MKLESLRTMDEIDRKRLTQCLIWVVVAVVLTLGSEVSHWWRHRGDAAPTPPVTTARVNSATR
jgi:hypothetical protein